MKEAAPAARPAPAMATWPRRVLVGFWLVAFIAAGVALGLRFDDLVSRLARLPVPIASGSGGSVR